MTQPKDDKAFDSYLKGQSPLSELYAKSTHQEEEPTEHVDETILQAAKAPMTAKQPTERRWYLPTSIAAVLVLSFILVLYYRHQPPPLSEYNKPPDAIGAETATPEPGAGLAEPKEQRRQRKSETAADTVAKPKLPEETPAAQGGKTAPSAPGPHGSAKSDQVIRAEGLSSEGFESAIQWLVHIQQLLDQDHREQAKAEFKAFSKQYPNYTLEEFPDIERLAASIPEKQ